MAWTALRLSFVETGWYKGVGDDFNTSVPKFYVVYRDTTGYHEGDDPGVGPSVGTQYSYQLDFNGYDNASGKYRWDFYYDGLVVPRQGYHLVSSLPLVAPLVGAEVTHGSGIGMSSHTYPYQELKDTIGGIHDWTAAYATAHAPTGNCVDSPFTISQIDAWQELRSTGTS